MAQYPLVLAIEPRLLPFARQNGFNMDRKVSEVIRLRGFPVHTLFSNATDDSVSRFYLPQNV